MLQKAGARSRREHCAFCGDSPGDTEGYTQAVCAGGIRHNTCSNVRRKSFQGKELGMSAKEVIKKALDVAVAVRRRRRLSPVVKSESHWMSAIWESW